MYKNSLFLVLYITCNLLNFGIWFHYNELFFKCCFQQSYSLGFPSLSSKYVEITFFVYKKITVTFPESMTANNSNSTESYLPKHILRKGNHRLFRLQRLHASSCTFSANKYICHIHCAPARNSPVLTPKGGGRYWDSGTFPNPAKLIYFAELTILGESQYKVCILFSVI